MIWVASTHVRADGVEWLAFHGNDYHKLSWHPEVREALVRGLETDGLNPGGSRATTGDHPAYRELEERLAEFLGRDAAIVLPSGSLANSAVDQAFGPLAVAPGSHASWPVRRSADGLRCTDAVEPNSGRLAADGLWDVLDEAHSVGVLGASGQGLCRSALITGTLGKAIGVFGGWVAGLAEPVQHLRRTHVYVASTPFPIPIARASMAAIDVLSREQWRVDLLTQRANAARAILGLAQNGVPILSLQGPRVGRVLLGHGIYPPFTTYPGCPEGGHYRVTISSAHREDEISRLHDALQAIANQSD